MRTLAEHKKAIIDYYKMGLKEMNNLFQLKVHMIELHLCPRCGKYLSRWSSSFGHFPCLNCNFNLTENEVDKILDDDRVSDKMRKSILNRKLRKIK